MDQDNDIPELGPDPAISAGAKLPGRVRSMSAPRAISRL